MLPAFLYVYTKMIKGDGRGMEGRIIGIITISGKNFSHNLFEM